jgi:general stress protein 26
MELYIRPFCFRLFVPRILSLNDQLAQNCCLQEKHKYMDDIQNLQGAQAIAKLGELAKNKICMMCNYTGEENINCRPMHTADVDESGNIWFLSQQESAQNVQLHHGSKVSLLYSNGIDDSYLVVDGEAGISRDPVMVDRLWTPQAKPWFPMGREDPMLELITVRPTSAHYWDTKHGRVTTRLHLLSPVVIPSRNGDGRQGDLRV